MDSLTVVRAITIVFIAAGFAFALRPDIYKGLLWFLVKGRMLYVVGAVRIVVGILFIWVGGRLRADILGMIGVIVLLMGILTLIVRLETQKAMVGRMIAKSETVHRCVGILVAIVGSLIFLETFVRW